MVRCHYSGITGEQIRAKFLINLPCKCIDDYEMFRKNPRYEVTLIYGNTVDKKRGRQVREVHLMCDCCGKKAVWYYDRAYQNDIDW